MLFGCTQIAHPLQLVMQEIPSAPGSLLKLPCTNSGSVMQSQRCSPQCTFLRSAEFSTLAENDTAPILLFFLSLTRVIIIGLTDFFFFPPQSTTVSYQREYYSRLMTRRVFTVYGNVLKWMYGSNTRIAHCIVLQQLLLPQRATTCEERDSQ